VEPSRPSTERRTRIAIDPSSSRTSHESTITLKRLTVPARTVTDLYVARQELSSSGLLLVLEKLRRSPRSQRHSGSKLAKEETPTALRKVPKFWNSWSMSPRPVFSARLSSTYRYIENRRCPSATASEDQHISQVSEVDLQLHLPQSYT
jgi:hypothetical protein